MKIRSDNVHAHINHTKRFDEIETCLMFYYYCGVSTPSKTDTWKSFVA